MMQKNTRILSAKISSALFVTLYSVINLGSPQMARAENIALNKPVEVIPESNYWLTSNKNPQQLTDGSSAAPATEDQLQHLWARAGTLGWQSIIPVTVIIDLETVQPISGVVYSTAAGSSGVNLPKSIYIAVSDDKQNWRFVGDIMTSPALLPHANKSEYQEVRLSLSDIRVRGRYVALSAISDLYVFSDEIEIIKGNDQQKDESIHLENFPNNARDFLMNIEVKNRIEKRVKADIESVQEKIEKSTLSVAYKAELTGKLNDISKLNPSEGFNPAGFKTIFPLNEVHRKIFAVYAEYLNKAGFKPLTVWNQQRYQWLPVINEPKVENNVQIHFDMLGNQYRSESLLLTNSSQEAAQINLRISDVPLGKNWLQVSQAEWTDTLQGVAVADALIPLQENDGIYSINVPAGMTRKVWLTVDSSQLDPGSYAGNIIIKDGNSENKIPLNIRVSSIEMKRPRLSLGVWDYSEGDGGVGITSQNRASSQQWMRSHYVNSVWAYRFVLPWPDETHFNESNALKSPMDFSRLEEWLKLWPDADRYFVFLFADGNFGGAKIGTNEFDQRVGAWSTALKQKMIDEGKDPSQLALLIIDEPHTDSQDEIIVAWAEALKHYTPEITIFQDPVWPRPDQAKYQKAITNADIICPELNVYYRGGEAVQKYFEKLRLEGKELWLYQCMGPARLYDPQGYHRFQAWHTFRLGGKGMGFWAFGDSSNGHSSWNEYLPGRVGYEPVFIDGETVTNSLHWDAVREGMQDYEELAMLKDKIEALPTGDETNKYQRLLDDAVLAVTGTWQDKSGVGEEDWIFENHHYRWDQQNTDPSLADIKLKEIRNAIEQLTSS